MNITCDCHFHTVSSGHAYSTLGEYVAEAKCRGLELIVMTDHGPQMPGGPHPWFFQNLRVVPRVWGSLDVWMGVEVNILDLEGKLDMSDGDLGALDLAVASFHTPFFPTGGPKACLTRAAIRVMENPAVTILGHPDDERLPLDYEDLARAAAATGCLLEVNNSSLLPTSHRRGARDNYRKMLDACVRHGARVVLDSDAHIHTDIGRCDASLALIEEIGFPEALVANTSSARLKAWVADRR